MPTHRTVYELNAPAPALVDAALAGSERAVFWLQDSPGSRGTSRWSARPPPI